MLCLFSARVGLVHPRRDVALAMQYAPDVDVIGAFDVEHQVWIARQRPEAQTIKGARLPAFYSARWVSCEKSFQRRTMTPVGNKIGRRVVGGVNGPLAHLNSHFLYLILA